MEVNVGEIFALYQDGLRVYRKWYLVVNEGPQAIKSLVHELRSAQTVFRFLLDEDSNADSALARLHDSQRDEFDILVDGCLTALQQLEKKHAEIVLGDVESNQDGQDGVGTAGNPRRRHAPPRREHWTTRATRAAGDLLEMQNNLSTLSHLLLVLLAMNDVSSQSATQERIEAILKSMMDYERKGNRQSAANGTPITIGADANILRSISLRKANSVRNLVSPGSPPPSGNNRLSVISNRGTTPTASATQPEVLTVRMASASNSPHVINLIFPTQKKLESTMPTGTHPNGHPTPPASDDGSSGGVAVTQDHTNGGPSSRRGGTNSQEMGSHHETVEATPGQSVQFSGDQETLDAVSSLLERVQRDFIDLNKGSRRESLEIRPAEPMVVKPSLSRMLMNTTFPDDTDGHAQRLAVYSLKDWLFVVKWWLMKARFEAHVYNDATDDAGGMNNMFGEGLMGNTGMEDEFELGNFLRDETNGKAKFAMLKAVWLLGDVLDPNRITPVLSLDEYSSICDLQKTLINELEENNAFSEITEFSERLERLLYSKQSDDLFDSFSEDELDHFQVLQRIHPQERGIPTRANSIVKDEEKPLLEVFISVEYRFQPRRNLLDPAAPYQDILIVTCSQDDPHAALLKIVNAEGTIVSKLLETELQPVHGLLRCFIASDSSASTANGDGRFSFAFPNPDDYAQFNDIVQRVKAGDFFTGHPAPIWFVEYASSLPRHEFSIYNHGHTETFERPMGRWSNCDLTVSDTALPGHQWGSRKRQIILKWKRRDQVAQSVINVPLNLVRFELDTDSRMYRVRMSWANKPGRMPSSPGSATSFDQGLVRHYRHCVELEGDVVLHDAYHDQRLPRKGVLSNHVSTAGSPALLDLPIVKCCASVEPNSGLTYYRKTSRRRDGSQDIATSWTCPFESMKMARRESHDGFGQDLTLCLEFCARNDALGFYETICQSEKQLVIEEETIAHVTNETQSSRLLVFESPKFPGQPRVLETMSKNGEELVRTSYVTSSTSFADSALRGLVSHSFGSRRLDGDSRHDDVVSSMDLTILNLATLRSRFPLIPLIRPHYFKLPFDHKPHCRFKHLSLIEEQPRPESMQASNASHVSKMSIKHLSGMIVSKATPRKKPIIFQAKSGTMDIYADTQRSNLRFVVFNRDDELLPGFLHFQVLVEPTFSSVRTDVISAEVSFEINQISSTADDGLSSVESRRGTLEISFYEREECSQFMDLHEDRVLLSRRASDLLARNLADNASLASSNTGTSHSGSAQRRA